MWDGHWQSRAHSMSCYTRSDEKVSMPGWMWWLGRDPHPEPRGQAVEQSAAQGKTIPSSLSSGQA